MLGKETEGKRGKSRGQRARVSVLQRHDDFCQQLALGARHPFGCRRIRAVIPRMNGEKEGLFRFRLWMLGKKHDDRSRQRRYGRDEKGRE